MGLAARRLAIQLPFRFDNMALLAVFCDLLALILHCCVSKKGLEPHEHPQNP